MPKRTKTKTLEVPVTAMSTHEMPDGALGSEWFKNYPVGTRVLVYETETVVPETSAEIPRIGRTAGPPQYDKHYYEGSRDYIKVEYSKDSAVIALRYHVFPAKAYPKITKDAGDREILETIGMKDADGHGTLDKPVVAAYQKAAAKKEKPKQKKTPQKQVKPKAGTIGEPSPKFAEPIASPNSVLSQKNAVLKEKQLREAYEERARIHARLDGYNPRSDPFRGEKTAIRANTRMLEQMLVASDRHSQGIILETLEKNESRLAEISRIKLAEKERHADDCQRLEKIKKRIEWLRVHGPDLQKSFLDEEIETPVDGKTAAAGG